MIIKNKNKGITLIALIITIIILLILAGVTISQLTGNGLFDKIQLAKEKYFNEQKKENKTLADYEEQISEYVGNGRDNNYGVIELDYDNSVDVSSYTSENNRFTFTSGGFLVVQYCEDGTSETRRCYVNISGYPFTQQLNDNKWGIYEHFSTIVNKDQTVYFTFSHTTNNVLTAYFIPFKK